MTATVVLSYCSSYAADAVAASVLRLVETMGGMSALVHPGERILIKPNLLGAKEPERHITTHPEVVRAVVRLVKAAGATPVVGDSPGGAIKGIDRVWDKTGMKRMAAEEGVELVNFETAGSREVPITHPSIPAVQVSNAVLECDGIINLPKLKTHGLMIFTGAIKNFYGVVPGLRKAEYHKLAPHPEEFGALLAEIYRIVRPKVRATIIDGIIGMEGNGPSSGDLREIHMLSASIDGLALDATLTRLLGFDPMKIEMLEKAAAAGQGEHRASHITLAGDPADRFTLTRFRFPSNWYVKLVPHVLVNVLGRLIWMKPQISSAICRNCLLCVESCPVRAIDSPRGGGTPIVRQRDCISCLCCHELCPYKAIELQSSWLSKRIIRQ